LDELKKTAQILKDKVNQDAAVQSTGKVQKVDAEINQCPVDHSVSECVHIGTSSSNRRRLAGVDRRLAHQGYEYTMVYTITSNTAADAALTGAADTTTTSAVSASNDAITAALTTLDVETTVFTPAVSTAATLSSVTITTAVATVSTAVVSASVAVAAPAPPPPPPCSSVCTTYLDGASASSTDLCVKYEGSGIVCRPLFSFKCDSGAEYCAQSGQLTTTTTTTTSSCDGLTDKKGKWRKKKCSKKVTNKPTKCSKRKIYRKCKMTCCQAGYSAP